MDEEVSEETEAPIEEQYPADETPPPSFRAITSQDELDRVLSERLRRERAKFADYADLRKKAEEYDKIAAASQTESERLNIRLSESESTST